MGSYSAGWRAAGTSWPCVWWGSTCRKRRHLSLCLMMSDHRVLYWVSFVKICQYQIFLLNYHRFLFIMILMIRMPFYRTFHMRSICRLVFGHFLFILFFRFKFLFHSFFDFLNNILSLWIGFIRPLGPVCWYSIVRICILWTISFLIPIVIILGLFISSHTRTIVIGIKRVPVHFTEWVVYILVVSQLLIVWKSFVVFHLVLVFSWVVSTDLLFKRQLHPLKILRNWLIELQTSHMIALVSRVSLFWPSTLLVSRVGWLYGSESVILLDWPLLRNLRECVSSEKGFLLLGNSFLSLIIRVIKIFLILGYFGAEFLLYIIQSDR